MSLPSLQDHPDTAMDLATPLMAQVQLGCHISFRLLHDATKSALSSAIWRINRDTAQIEEILQEVYERAWLMRAQFDPGRGHVMSWLKSIAHNQAVNSLRSNSRRPLLLASGSDVVDDYAGLVSSDPSPEEHLRIRELSAAIQQRLRKLTVDQRHAITLAFFSGLSHDEIARSLVKPLGTVKTWIRRSLISMQADLGAHV